jgi:diaminopimelate epimerase
MTGRGKLGEREFAKYHALGNDYIVVDRRTFGIALTPARIRSICNRHTGVGSDGILALVPTRSADFAVRIFNPDGSEAEKSGNGVRIFARFLFDCGYTRGRSLRILTKGGMVRATLDVRHGAVRQISVDMGQATFVSTRIPVRGRQREVVDEPLELAGRRFRVTCVSVGNPHCVIFVPRLCVDDLRRFGPLIERHPRFPQRINVQFARVRSRRIVDALIWERGAGETMASGSSSCAIAAAAVKRGLVDGSIAVRMPGGCLAIEVNRDFELKMSGPATPVYRGIL